MLMNQDIVLNILVHGYIYTGEQLNKQYIG